tara:strand:+ start:1265 stop:1459 length:195 start_codon:yes stop_codon:yes gene_type:complete
MADQQTIERIQQERHSANHDRLYQATLKEVQDNLSEETKIKIKDMLKTKSPEQVKQAIYLFFRS